jgi:hypothetical protein
MPDVSSPAYARIYSNIYSKPCLRILVCDLVTPLLDASQLIQKIVNPLSMQSATQTPSLKPVHKNASTSTMPRYDCSCCPLGIERE